MNGIEKIPVTSENGDSLNVTGFGAQQKVELGNYTKEVSMDISPEELERELIPQSVFILIQRLIANREKLANIGLGLGLNPAYLELLNSQPLQVGFGEQNFPLPTLFPDGVDEMKESFGVSEAIKMELKGFGLDSTLNSLLTLKWDSFVSSG